MSIHNIEILIIQKLILKFYKNTLKPYKNFFFVKVIKLNELNIT